MAYFYRFFFLVWIASLSAFSFADFYQASLQDAKLEFKKVKNTCYLTQVVPLYGTADFVQIPGRPLLLALQEKRSKPLIMKATLKVLPAPWIHDEVASPDYLVYLDNSLIGGYGKLYVSAETAERMIDALLQGQYPTFIYQRDASAVNLEETRVSISAIKFYESYQEFVKCRNGVKTTTAQNQPASGKKSKLNG